MVAGIRLIVSQSGSCSLNLAYCLTLGEAVVLPIGVDGCWAVILKCTD